jgi:hypothetical protein
VHVGVVALEQLGTDPDLAHLGRPLGVPGLELVEGEAEAVPPDRPHLPDPGQVGDVVVLDAAQVPQQPGDGVGLRIRSVGRDVVGQALGQAGDELTDPVERVLEQCLGQG